MAIHAMKMITRTSPAPENSFKETVEGELPHSVDISTNAKGQAQFSIKLHYESVTEINAHVRNDLFEAIMEIKSALEQASIPLAGGGSASNGKEQQS